MLVIRRKRGESIVIGDGIEVEVLESAAGHVKLGIAAPRDILVLRKEIQAAADANRAAARPVSASALRSLADQIKVLHKPPIPHR